MLLTHTYANNGFMVSFTVDSYTYDADNSAAIITTEECGDVCINSIDVPDTWAQFISAIGQQN